MKIHRSVNGISPKSFHCLLALLFFPIIQPITANAANLSAAEMAYLEKKGVIVFISQTVYPPFESVDKEGEHVGMCIELARWISTEFGFKTRFTDSSFKDAQEAILAQKADVLTSFFYSEKRDKFFDFTQMVFQVPAYIFVAADRPDIKAIDDLNGKTIAMQMGDYAQEFLDSHNISFQVLHTRNFAEATDLVISGQADALIGDEQIVLFHVYSDNLTEYIKKVGEPLFTGQNCMSVKEGNEILLSILKKGIKQAREKGVLERINRKWLGVTYDLQVSFWEKYQYFIEIIIGSMAFVLVLVWSWNTKLRGEVYRRTNALVKSENTLKAILAASPVGIGILRDQKIDWANDAMKDMLGYSLPEMKGSNPGIFYPDTEHGRVTEAKITAALETSGFATIETRWCRKNGSIFDCLLRYAPVPNGDDTNLVIAIATDITERKEAENNLRRAKEEWEQTFDTVPDLIMILDENYDIQKINRAMADALNLSNTDCKGLKCYEYVHGTSAPPAYCPHAKLIEDGLEHTAEIFEPFLKGHFMVSVSPLTDSSGQFAGSVHVARNITDRKVHEQRVEKLSMLRAKLIQAGECSDKLAIVAKGLSELFSPIGFRVWVVGEDAMDFEAQNSYSDGLATQVFPFGRHVLNLWLDTFNDGEEAVARHRDEQEKDCLKQMICGRMNKITAAIKGTGASDAKAWYTGYRLMSSLGTTIGFFSIISIQPLRKEENTLLEAVIETIAQMLEVERAANALKFSEKRYRRLFESLIDVYFRTDAEGIITMLSPSVEQVTGTAPDELLGMCDVDFFVNPEEWDYFKKKVKQRGVIQNQEVLMKKKDNTQIWVSVNAKMIENNEGNFSGVEGLFRDITSNKQAEELMRIQRNLGMALGYVSSLDDALNVCLDSALKVQGADCCCIYMVDPKTGGLDLMAHRRMHPDIVDRISHLDRDSPRAQLVYRGKAVFLRYDEMMERFGYSLEQESVRERFGFLATAMVPMQHEDQIIGCLNVASTTTDMLNDFAQYSLETIAAQMAGALARIKTDQALKVSQHNLNTLFESLDDFLLILDSAGNIVEVNPSVEKKLGYSKDELLNMSVAQVHPPERRGEANQIMEAMLAGKTDSCMVPLLTRDGRTIPVETKINMGIWNGQPALFGISRDIRLRLEAEEAHRVSEERLKAAIDVIDEGFVIYDAQDRLAMCNSKYLEILKVSEDFIRPGARFEDILREGARRGQYLDVENDIESWMVERLKQHRRCDSKVEQQLADGRWIRIAERKMQDGSTVGFRVDITDIKRANEMIQRTLQEKEILLKEIHHRVKNNMQVVSSLLSLQANRIESPLVLEVFAEAQARVQSIALVHETLYHSSDLRLINLQDYFDRLIMQIVHLFLFEGSQVDVEANADDVRLDVDQAATCGLIMVELLTNALKYAFPGKKSGSICIRAQRNDTDRFELKVSDNGVGMPDAFDPRAGKTLGLKMVIELVEDQLEGRWQFDGHGGVHWAIVWPIHR